LRVDLAAVAAPLLPTASRALSTAASREVRFATCFSSATSRGSGADSTPAPEGSGGVDVTGTGLAGAAVLARRVEGTLAATGLLAGPAAVALPAGTDVAAFFTVALFAGALLSGAVVGSAFVVGTLVAVVFFAEAVVAPAGLLVAVGFAGVAFSGATVAAVRLDGAVARTALTVLDFAGAEARGATAFTDGPVPGPVCAAA